MTGWLLQLDAKLAVAASGVVLFVLASRIRTSDQRTGRRVEGSAPAAIFIEEEREAATRALDAVEPSHPWHYHLPR
jgi:hypothetical protein